MTGEASYWLPLCELVSRLRCWVRICARTGRSTRQGRWGQLLTSPTAGYLEASGGPVALGDVEWVEVSLQRIVAGIAGRPMQMVDIKDDVLSELSGTQLIWDVREGTWSIEGILDEEPVQVVRVLNPCGPAPVS